MSEEPAIIPVTLQITLDHTGLSLTGNNGDVTVFPVSPQFHPVFDICPGLPWCVPVDMYLIFKHS